MRWKQGTCPCYGICEKRFVEIDLAGDRYIVLHQVPEGFCMRCNRTVYKANVVAAIEAVVHSKSQFDPLNFDYIDGDFPVKRRSTRLFEHLLLVINLQQRCISHEAFHILAIFLSEIESVDSPTGSDPCHEGAYSVFHFGLQSEFHPLA